MPRSPTTHIDDPRLLAGRLRAGRQAAGLSQRGLAAGLCSPAYVSRVEAGDRIPSLQLIAAFAERCGVSTQYLATGVDAALAEAELLDAELALRLGEVDEARRLFAEHVRRGGAARASALAGLGQIAFREGQYPRAVQLLEEALQGPQPPHARPAAIETLARAHASTGALEAAIALTESAFTEAQTAGASLESLRYGVLLANALIDSGDFDRAATTLAAVIPAADSVDDPTAAARVFWSQSRLHVLRGDPALAARYAHRAIELLERTEDDAYTAWAYHTLAFVELEAGDPAAALEHLERGRALFGKRLTRYYEAKFSLEEARALLATGQERQAAKAAARALGAIEALDRGDRGRAYLVLGDVFAATGDDARAEELWELALEFLEGSGKPYLVDAASRLAEALERRGRSEDALQVLKRAVRPRIEPPQAVRRPPLAR